MCWTAAARPARRTIYEPAASTSLEAGDGTGERAAPARKRSARHGGRVASRWTDTPAGPTNQLRGSCGRQGSVVRTWGTAQRWWW